MRTTLGKSELQWEEIGDGLFMVELPGERKLKTVASLVVSDTALSVSAFVIRNPDENHEEFYRFLLGRNLRLPGLAYAVDRAGDVYVTGRMPASGVDAGSLDQLLGVVLTAADEPFVIEEATIDGVQAAIRDGRTTCVQVVEAHIERAKAYNGICTALVTADGAEIAPAFG